MIDQKLNLKPLITKRIISNFKQKNENIKANQVILLDKNFNLKILVLAKTFNLKMLILANNELMIRSKIITIEI
jgi:hypothetical protein